MKPSEVNRVDMVSMDEEVSVDQGVRIATTIKAAQVLKYKDLIVEGKVYALSHFGVADNNLRVRMTIHPFRINFQSDTGVKEVKTGFPLDRSIFTFVDFGALLDGTVAEDQVIDVMGVLTGYTDILNTTTEGSASKRVCFELQDATRRRLRCTLWADLAEQFKKYVASMDVEMHTVVVVQLGRRRSWLGKPGLSNCYFGTKLFFNSEEPLVSTFRAQLSENAKIPTTPEKFPDLEKLNLAYTLKFVRVQETPGEISKVLHLTPGPC